MGNEITSNPNPAEPIVDKEGLPTQQQIDWNDELELKLNRNLLGAAVRTPIYKANQTPSNLPNAWEHKNSWISVIGGVAALDSIPVYSTTNFSTFAFPVLSVTEVGGITQFNFSGGDVGANRGVILFDFDSKPTYNIEVRAAVSGIGFFQVPSIDFVGTDTGKFLFGSDWRDIINHAIVV